MAKKSRRARRQRTTRRPSAPPPTPKTAQAPQPSATPDEERPAAAPVPAQRKEVDFRVEYGYVIGDLRSMGIIAIFMLAVLIALSFVIG
jgi:hypothetical protein